VCEEEDEEEETMSFQEQVDDSPDQEMLQDFLRLSARIIIYLGYCVLFYAVILTPIAALFSTLQEYKIWKTTPTPMTPFAFFKCFCLNISWMILCLIGAITLLPMWAQRGFGNSVQKEAFCVMETLVSFAVFKVFVGEVVINGEEKLPELSLDGCLNDNGDGPIVAPVYIANHSSHLDCFAIYHVLRRFKWIAKDSVKYVPGVGNIAYLSNHVLIKRSGKNGKSKGDLFQKSSDAVQNGLPMFLFPQGTRRMSEKLPFKAGAFKIAVDNETRIVPISIHVPLGIWNNLYPISLLWGAALSDENKIIITVHDLIQTTSASDIDKLKEECCNIIYSVLPALHDDESETNITTDKQEQDKKNI